MPDRLAELVRQRALVQEHLAWLDREIARAAEKPVEPSASGPSVTIIPAHAPVSKTTDGAPISPGASGTPRSEADEILEKYRAAPQSVEAEVRKGCFLYFAAALVLLGATVAVLYFTIGSR